MQRPGETGEVAFDGEVGGEMLAGQLAAFHGEHVQNRDGDFVGRMDTPGGEVSTMRTPLVIDGARPNVRRGPRRMGEDSDEIFGD